MKKSIMSIIIILFLIGGVYFLLAKKQKVALAPENTSNSTSTAIVATSTPTQQTTAESIIIFSPIKGEYVTSPLKISGKARGEWFFEGTLPIILLDSAGGVIARASAVAQGAWTTHDFVDFVAMLEFGDSTSTATSGTLVFSKENPSGLPRNNMKTSVSVNLKK